jgi:retron-type reverse transcriptase
MPGPEVEHFEAAAARHIGELAESLSDGTFQPHPVVRAELAKPSGGTRRLAIPAWPIASWSERCWPSWIR